MFKFVFGPIFGYLADYSVYTSILITVLGMMSSVFVFTFFGEFLKRRVLRRLFRRRKVFTKRNRRFVVIWRKYGIPGVAALTPLLLTPIGGTIVLTTFGSPRRKVFLYMFISAVFWSIIITNLVYIVGDPIIEWFNP
ncbi:MAG: hypothetical protein AAFX87_08330 [Bacteroidota bacterium]